MEYKVRKYEEMQLLENLSIHRIIIKGILKTTLTKFDALRERD
jgi:hypothetical protein